MLDLVEIVSRRKEQDAKDYRQRQSRVDVKLGVVQRGGKLPAYLVDPGNKRSQVAHAK